MLNPPEERFRFEDHSELPTVGPIVNGSVLVVREPTETPAVKTEIILLDRFLEETVLPKRTVQLRKHRQHVNLHVNHRSSDPEERIS